METDFHRDEYGSWNSRVEGREVGRQVIVEVFRTGN